MGIDSSTSMLERSAQHAGDGLSFELGDIAEWAPSEPYDVIFSNAALHWVDDHPAQPRKSRTALEGYVRRAPMLEPEGYAVLLHQLGFEAQHVRSQVYLHVLPEPAAVVEWVKGTLLTDYRRRLPDHIYGEFLARYRTLLLAELGEERPYPFAFKRILLWGRR